MGVCLAGLRNVKGSTGAVVEWTSWKAVGDEVREASGSQTGFEPRHEAADFHGDSTSRLQPEHEVSGVRQEGEEAEARDEGGVDKGGSWEQRRAAEKLVVPRRQSGADFPMCAAGRGETESLPTAPLPAAGCLPRPALVESKSQRWDRLDLDFV